MGAVGVEPTGLKRTTVLQTDPTPYGTTHPRAIIYESFAFVYNRELR